MANQKATQYKMSATQGRAPRARRLGYPTASSRSRQQGGNASRPTSALRPQVFRPKKFESKNTSRKPAGRNAPAKALAGNRQAVVPLRAHIILLPTGATINESFGGRLLRQSTACPDPHGLCRLALSSCPPRRTFRHCPRSDLVSLGLGLSSRQQALLEHSYG